MMEAGGVVKTLDGKTFHSHASSMICELCNVFVGIFVIVS